MIGDWIEPQATSIGKGEIIVNYADCTSGEPMSTAPSVGKSKYFHIVNGTLVVR